MQDDCYCTLLRTVARRMTAIYDEALDPVGINLAQFSLLRKIGRLDHASLTALAAAVGLDRSTIGRNVHVLERLGLVVIESGNDHREATVRLSVAGTDTLGRAQPLWRKAQERVRAAFGITAIERMRDLLARI
jgi:DNA-binding MarR family transcriptional regulator